MPQDWGEDTLRAKWAEMASAIDRLAERVADPADFAVLRGSALFGDDTASHPFEVSQAVRHLINASVDQLHAIKVLNHDVRAEHLAVAPTLARAALENTATALWILGPKRRNERLTNTYRWHARNYIDERNTVGDVVGDAPDGHIEQLTERAAVRDLNVDLVRNGYATSAPVKGAEPFTDIKVKYLWSVASAFAHGRPWAYQGFLRRQQMGADDRGHPASILQSRQEVAIWLPLQAVHLLGEVMRLRDRRAGYQMPPMPDGSPDSERPRR